MICPECESIIDDNLIVCPQCGFEMTNDRLLEKKIKYTPKWTIEEAKTAGGEELSSLITEILIIRNEYDKTRIPQNEIKKQIDELTEKAPRPQISPLGIISLIIVTLVCGFLAIDFLILACLFVILAIILYVVVIVVDGIIFNKSYEKRKNKYYEEKIEPLRNQLSELEKDNKKIDESIGVDWAIKVVGKNVFYSDHIEKIKVIAESGMAQNIDNVIKIWEKTITEIDKISK